MESPDAFLRRNSPPLFNIFPTILAPSPLKLVAVTTPVTVTPDELIVTPVPTLRPTSLGPNSQLFAVLPHVKVLLLPCCVELNKSKRTSNNNVVFHLE